MEGCACGQPGPVTFCALPKKCQCQLKHQKQYRINTANIREAVKYYLADFFRQGGGGYPPIPLAFFGQNDFPLMEGGEGGAGDPPNSA